MSDPAVTAYLTKLLCSHGGRLERNQLTDLLNLPDEQIEQILQDEPLRFPQISQLVLARSPLRICTRYLFPKGEEEIEEDCPKLHLCRHYLRAQCLPHRRLRCRFSHDVQSEHNRAVLKSKELIGLNEEEIKILLFQNDSSLLPEICQNYKQDNCDQGDDCTRLHVCSYFVHGGCNRRFCRKSHNLLDSKLLLTCHWLSKMTIQNFQMLCMLESNEKQQAPRQELTNEKPRGARGMSRGRGRGKPGYRRRTGSQDLLDNRSRERGNEGIRWRSHSRPPSQCSAGQLSGDDHFNDSDSSDHGRYTKTKLDNLMDDWFTPNTAKTEKAQVRSSGRVTQKEGTRSITPIKDLGMSSSVIKPLMLPTHARPMQPLNSRLTTNLTKALYETQKLNHGTSNASNMTTMESYLPHPNAHYSSVQERPKVSPEIEQLGYPATQLSASSRPTLIALKSSPSITSPKPSTISSTSFGPPREYPSSQTNPTNVSSLNRPVHLSTGGSSEARVSSSSIVSNHTEFSPTKHPSTPNQKTDMRLGMALDSSMTRLSIAPSTPSHTTLYSTTEMSSITQPATPTISGHMGTSSSSTLSNVTLGSDISSRKLQVSVKPFIKTESSAQYSLLDEDLDYFCLPPMATNSAANRPQPANTIPSLLPEKSSRDQTPEICLSNILKYCSLKDNCPDMHYCLPYRWQVFSGRDWEDLPNMEDIEKAYSDPKNDRYQLIDFQAMKSGVKPVRRLTTPSSVTQPEYALSTEWCWYWKNDSGTWIEYGQCNAENMNTTIQPSSLENIYLSDPTGSIPFIDGNQSYVIECREMKQKNTLFKTEREVRRRPQFVTIHDVMILRGSTKSAIDKVKQNQPYSHLKTEIYPPHWGLEAMTRIGYMKVLLPPNSSEFTNIAALFSKTISDHSVKQIWRVQNSSLWELYQRQKDLMKEKTFGNTVQERQLFHGADPATIETISKQNFDRYICGTSSTAYGLGNYFSQEASYAHNYSQPSAAGMRAMFLARVLVGDFTEGNPRMMRPPQKYGSGESYDSCVDNISNPSIFVVFEKCQVYPEYILEYQEKYKKNKTPCLVN